jgi:hypothetical protein
MSKKEDFNFIEKKLFPGLISETRNLQTRFDDLNARVEVETELLIAVQQQQERILNKINETNDKLQECFSNFLELKKQLQIIQNSKIKKRLFFSDGYYNTAVSGAIAQQLEDGASNFLLISIDHQNSGDNLRFAHHCGFELDKIELIDLHRLTHFENLHQKAVYWDEIFYPFISDLRREHSHFIYGHLYMTDEGLESYAQIERLYQKREQYEELVSGGFYLNPNRLTDSKHAKAIDRTIWRNLLAKLTTFYYTPLLEEGTKNILYCQSSLYHGSPEFDALNLSFLETLIASGFHIWCKLHPRYDTSLTKYLKEKVSTNAEHIHILDRNIPIWDIFVEKNIGKITAIIGEHGTSLINANIYNIPAYRLKFICDKPERFQHLEETITDIPPIENFLKTL